MPSCHKEIVQKPDEPAKDVIRRLLSWGESRLVSRLLARYTPHEFTVSSSHRQCRLRDLLDLQHGAHRESGLAEPRKLRLTRFGHPRDNCTSN